MTEISEKTAKQDIHWVGFGFSLIGTPLLVSAALLAPLFVLDAINDELDLSDGLAVMRMLLIIGSTLYLVIGTPVLIYHLKYHVPRMGRIINLSFLSVFAMLPIGALLTLVTMDPTLLIVTGISTCFGLIGAPVFAIVFTGLYQRFTRS